MSAEPLLQFRRLRKHVGGRCLLDIPEFAIQQGRCILLSGENGAGKTTLLKIIAGLEPPDSASVYYQGKALPWSIARRHCRRHVVYVHQTPYLFDSSVSDNIAYGLRRAGLPHTEVRAKVKEALAWAGLAHIAQRNARQLSGGEKQRVALARARIISPRVLLLDEPTASMDHESRERTYFLIQRLKSKDIGVVITSHELHRISSVGDVRFHLHQGKLHNDFDFPTRHASRQPAAGVFKTPNWAGPH